MSGSGVRKSAPRSRQITTPAPHCSVFFTGRMPFLPPNQQCQSTVSIYNHAVNLFQGEPVPGPLPLGVAVIDSSVRLYGLVFPHVAHKHRLQMLEHFGECIKQAKASRQQAIQINIFTAVLYALKVKCLLLFKSYCHWLCVIFSF